MEISTFVNGQNIDDLWLKNNIIKKEKDAGIWVGRCIWEVNILPPDWVITDFTAVRQITLKIRHKIASITWHG